MTTAGLLLFILFIAGIKSFEADIDRKASQYDRSKISVGKMAADDCRDPHKVNQRILSGYYDKDDKWAI